MVKSYLKFAHFLPIPFLKHTTTFDSSIGSFIFLLIKKKIKFYSNLFANIKKVC